MFFALTGAVQLYNLHEQHDGYQPMPLVEKLSSVHKDQVFRLGDHHEAPAPKSDAPKTDADEDKPPAGTLLLKGFFLLVALGLTASTVLGIWIGLTQIRSKSLAWSLLIAGTVIPAILLLCDRT